MMIDEPNNLIIAVLVYPTSGNSYCHIHNQVTLADDDCTSCIGQRRCPHYPVSCNFIPTNSGPSIAMYREIMEHLISEHSGNTWSMHLADLCEDNMKRLLDYDS